MESISNEIVVKRCWPSITKNSSKVPSLWAETRHVPEMADDIAALLAGGCVVRKIKTELSHESLEAWQDSIWSLLYLAGYLTRASEARMQQSGARPRARGEMALAILNKEVCSVFAEDYVVWFQSIAKRQEDGDRYCALGRRRGKTRAASGGNPPEEHQQP